MPTPIQNPSTYDPSTHYDAEAGMCVAPAPASSPPVPESPAAVEPGQGSQAAVDQLVRSVDAKQEQDCFLPIANAAVNCLTAALQLASTPGTGPVGVALGLARAGSCGIAVANAVDCLE